MTLELAVEDAVRAAAPEISAIEVVTAQPAAEPSVIPADALLARVRSNGSTVHANSWHPVPELAELAPGEVAGFRISDTTVVVCRVGDLPLAYVDHCPVCDDTLAGAQLRETLLGCPAAARNSTSCTRAPVPTELTSIRCPCCSATGCHRSHWPNRREPAHDDSV